MKTRFYYFKIAFVSLFVGLLAGRFVYLVLTHWNEDNFGWLRIFLMSLTVAFLVALVMGVINMFAKYDLKKRSAVNGLP